MHHHIGNSIDRFNDGDGGHDDNATVFLWLNKALANGKNVTYVISYFVVYDLARPQIGNGSRCNCVQIKSPIVLNIIIAITYASPFAPHFTMIYQHINLIENVRLRRLVLNTLLRKLGKNKISHYGSWYGWLREWLINSWPLRFQKKTMWFNLLSALCQIH